MREKNRIESVRPAKGGWLYPVMKIAAALCWLLSLYFYVEMPGVPSESVFLVSVYPDQGHTEEILAEEREAELPADLCFYWDGGIQVIGTTWEGSRTKAFVGGVSGNAALYDWQAGALAAEDKEGCVIDEGTAEALFKTRQAVGCVLTVFGEDYIVRRVADWSVPQVLLHPRDRELSYTRVFVHTAKERNSKNAVESLLLKYGLGGVYASDGGVSGAALTALALYPAGLLLGLLLDIWEKRTKCDENTWKYWAYRTAYGVIVITLLVTLWKSIHIPKDWIPGKWSDFGFWTEKIGTLREEISCWLMTPKTAVQTERLICAGKGAAAGLLALLVDRKRPGHL